MSRPSRRLANLVEYALLAGHLSIRPARITDGDRFKIDARDPAHTVVWVRADLSLRESADVRDALTERLAELVVRRHRRELAPVAELEGDETFLDELAETGTDPQSELAARARRLTFGVIEGEG